MYFYHIRVLVQHIIVTSPFYNWLFNINLWYFMSTVQIMVMY